MPRRLAHFSDPRLDAQIGELIKHSNATRDAADKHAARRDNPHNVTAAQVGAVPVTGGTMTGKLTAPSYGAKDTRNTATAPGDYDMEMRLQFKRLSAIGLSGIALGTYCQLLGYRAWTDDTGGRAHELAFTDGGIYYRNGTKAAGWGPWQKVWHAGNDGAGSGLDADMLDGYHASYFQEAINELNAKVEVLQARVAALEGSTP